MRTLRHAFFLALSYLASAPFRTAILLLGTTTALFLPSFTWTAADRLESGLLERARSTPVLLGAKGNEFDLTMSALYFRGQVRDPVLYGLRHKVTERDYGIAVPMHVGHSAGGSPLIGTVPEYYEQRGLTVSDGRLPAMIGEITAGSTIAADLNLELGASLRSDLSNLYNIAGSYPVLLKVVGILKPSGTADDEAFFASVETAWMLDGKLHGHEDVNDENALNREGSNLEASPALFVFAEVKAENLAGFHMHGNADLQDVTCILVFPNSDKSRDQLLGDFVLETDHQAVEPEAVVMTVLGIVLRLKEGLSAYFALVAASTASFFLLVLVLSLRLRAEELRLMRRIGSSRATIFGMVAAEVAVLLTASAIGTVGLTWAAVLVLETLLV